MLSKGGESALLGVPAFPCGGQPSLLGYFPSRVCGPPPVVGLSVLGVTT